MLDLMGFDSRRAPDESGLRPLRGRLRLSITSLTRVGVKLGLFFQRPRRRILSYLLAVSVLTTILAFGKLGLSIDY